MTRQRSTGGRTTQPRSADRAVESEIPSLRQRRPVMFWVVVIAVLAMVLSTISSFATLF